MEKFNIKTEVKKLTEIYDSKKPTKEQFTKAVKDNLPKAQNADVDSFNEFIGLKDKHPAEKYQDRINQRIEKHTNSKEDSIKKHAILRDSAMFAVAELGQLTHEAVSQWDVEAVLKSLHQKWFRYFREMYE